MAIDILATPALKEMHQFLVMNCKGLDIKYTLPTQYHLTLAFLGKTNQEQIDFISVELNNLSMQYNPFELELNGAGLFKNLCNAQTLWIGIKPSNTIQSIYSSIRNIIIKQGFTCKPNSYSPHLTIGRIKRLIPNHNLEWILKQLEGKTFGNVMVDKVVFYVSVLTANGPNYHALQEFYFKQNNL